MIKLFLDFLRKICNVQEGRLRLSLHLYDDQNESALRKYWSSITKIPLGQFHSTHIHKGKTGSYKKKSKYGTASIKYGDKKLLQQILEKINDF